jgi:phosphatidate cytidylyltransferase
MARTISAAILVPIATLVVIYASPLVYLIGIGLVGTVCLYEYFRLLRSMGVRVQPLFGYLAFWVLLIAFRQGRFPATVVLALVMLAGFLSAMWRSRQPVRERAWALMSELFGIFYLALFLYPAIPLRYDFGDITGLHWTLVLLFVIWAGDTVALAVGKTLGRSPFAPVLSPKKTKEGAIAGLLAGVAIGAAMQHFLFSDLPLRHVLIAAVLLGIFGQLGDLAESMLKRAAEIKDSSQLIPGHGGVLDRMDSLLFALPVLYFYLLQIYGGV